MLQSSYLSPEFINDIWPAFRLTLKKSTAKSYEVHLNDLCDRLRCDFFEITPSLAISYFQNLIEEDAYSIRTLYTKLYAYRSISNYIVEHQDEFELSGYHSPFEAVSLPHYSSNITASDIIPLTELDAILDFAKIHDSYVYYALLLSLRCALSTSELINFRCDNFSVNEKGEGMLGVTSESGFFRLVKVPCDVVSEFREAPLVSGEYFFQSRKGHMTARTLQRRVSDVVAGSGVSKSYTLQDFRTTSLSYMIDGGASLDEVAAYAGITAQSLPRFQSFTPSSVLQTCDFNRIQIKGESRLS